MRMFHQKHEYHLQYILCSFYTFYFKFTNNCVFIIVSIIYFAKTWHEQDDIDFLNVFHYQT
jgi:hypothetical protein